MKKTVAVFITLLSLMSRSQSLPKVTSGVLERVENFKSKYIDNRIIDIWLPSNYKPENKYAVLYMQDGQMLFDPTTTWNKQAWEVDAVVTKLIQENKINNLIVVGIWNGNKVRHACYFPEKPYKKLTAEEKIFVTKKLKEKGRTTNDFKPNSDNYLKFLVKELKPYIDKKYAVHTDSQHTFVAGSSMGGLISIYAICEYPNIFGGAACLSTHWTGIFETQNNPIPETFLHYLKQNLPNPKYHKIYFDCGDQTLDAQYPEIQKKVDAIMITKGYTQQNWLTQYFPGKDHSEKSWNERLHIPLEFLIQKQ